MDTVMYNICFNIICHENKSSDSLSLMMNMIETGFKPNNVTYNTILKGLCKEIIEEALELFYCLEWDTNGPDLSFVQLYSFVCSLPPRKFSNRTKDLSSNGV